MSAYSKVIEEHAAAIGGAAAAQAAGVKQPTTPQEFMGLPHLPGARVLDKISGQEGTVIDGSIKRSLVSAS